MRIVSVTASGTQTIVYKDKDYFYQNSDGTHTRVPDEKRKGFNSSIFRDPSQPSRPIVQAERDAFKAGVEERRKLGLLQKPEAKSENND